MRTLFIDTSSSDVSIAIISDNKILSIINESIPNAHSLYTVDFLDKIIKKAELTPGEIDKILVVTGPGSFTGVRIGVTIAKTYAYLNKIDIVGVSSLKMLALSRRHNYCLSLISANHDNYYLGLFDEDNNVVIEEQFNTQDKVLEIIALYNPLIVSNTNLKIGDIEIEKQALDVESIASYYQNIASSNPHFMVPNYLKLPQALEVRNDQRSI